MFEFYKIFMLGASDLKLTVGLFQYKAGGFSPVK